MEIDYYSKYLKYKNKYLTLQRHIGGKLTKYNFTKCNKDGTLEIKETRDSTYEAFHTGTFEKMTDGHYQIKYTDIISNSQHIMSIDHNNYNNNKTYHKSCKFIKDDINKIK